MKSFAALLLKWYAQEARAMPWRVVGQCHPNPYAVWVSEIMLQQTTVKTVLPYYDVFLKRFPTVKDLAIASEESILHAWQGLGYYSRARNLHQGAQFVSAKGSFPRTFLDWQSVKGVGRYTAAALASFCAGESVPVVDGNVKRVFARLFCLEEMGQDLEKTVFKLSQTEMKGVLAGDYNSAVMDLGAMICSPQNPQCLLCPVSKICQAFKAQKVKEYPKSLPKKELPIRYGIVRWIELKGALCIRKRETGILKGLYELPWDEVSEDIFKKQKGDSIKHTFTHFHLFLKVRVSEQKEGILIPLSELSRYPFSNLMKKVLKEQFPVQEDSV